MAIQLSTDDLRSLAILSAAGMGVAGLPAGAGRGMGGTAGILLGGARARGRDDSAIDPAISRYMADGYPTRFTPNKDHTYDVAYIPGDANNNAYGKVYKDIIEKAGRMQTIDEHNAALTKYIRPGMDPVAMHMAVSLGAEEEKKLPQFWDESSDVGNDRAKFNVSSSAVSGIRITPDARIEVQWGTSPTWYTFRQFPNTYKASEEAQKLLMADSIGRAVMPFQRNGKPLKFKNKDVKYSEWNRPNYDAAFANHK